MSTVDASRSRAATIYDVARLAGVSPATVSRVMRHSAPVSTGTRGRVTEAMSELGFVPSRLGVSLAEGRHVANGIVFPSLSGPYFAEVVLGYEEEAGALERPVILVSTRGRTAASARVFDLASRVDGLVVLGRTVTDDVVAEVVGNGLPVVTLARRPVEGADSVNADNSGSAQALGRHLLEHGHRRVVRVGDPVGSPDVAERWAGLDAVLDDDDVTDLVSDGFDVEAGRRAGRQLLAGALPDVIVASNDELALGVLDAAAEVGVRVPRDLAVTGWDDVMASRWAGLTTVRQPMRELGATAARLLEGRIGGAPVGPRTSTLPTELVTRTSCGCPDRGGQL